VNESKSIRLEVTDEFYLSPIVRTDKAAYLEHFADPEIAHNLEEIKTRCRYANQRTTIGEDCLHESAIGRILPRAAGIKTDAQKEEGRLQVQRSINKPYDLTNHLADSLATP
jgi:hypothetical protein